MAVNVERQESDLTPVESQAIVKRMGLRHVAVVRDNEELDGKLRDHRVGRTFGEHLLWLAFLMCVAEVAYANRKAHRTSAHPAGLSVAPSGRIAVDLHARTTDDNTLRVRAMALRTGFAKRLRELVHK